MQSKKAKQFDRDLKNQEEEKPRREHTAKDWLYSANASWLSLWLLLVSNDAIDPAAVMKWSFVLCGIYLWYCCKKRRKKAGFLFNNVCLITQPAARKPLCSFCVSRKEQVETSLPATTSKAELYAQRYPQWDRRDRPSAASNRASCQLAR